MDFAKLIHSTQQYIAQVENCKDDSRRFGRAKEDIILKEASLPPGFFVYVALAKFARDTAANGILRTTTDRVLPQYGQGITKNDQKNFIANHVACR